MTTQATGSAVKSDTGFAAIFCAAALGLFFIFGSGFAAPNMAHNAAHDTRHATAFPCH